MTSPAADADIVTVVPGPITIRQRDLVVQKPDEVRRYKFDWPYPDGVYLTDDATITVEPVDPIDATLGSSLLGVEAGHVVHMLLGPGTSGALFRVHNTIVTLEMPSQTKEVSFFLQIEP